MSKVYASPSKYCLNCFEDLEQGILDILLVNDPLCYHCREAMGGKKIITKVKGIKIMSAYVYQGLVRTNIILYKERFDEKRAEIFITPLLRHLHLFYTDYEVVYVPSTKLALKRREFDHMSLIAQSIKLRIIPNILVKSDSVKQSTLDVKQREEVSQYFHILNHELITNKKLILIDDVVTTGASIKACYELLEPYAKKILVIGLCVHPKLLRP